MKEKLLQKIKRRITEIVSSPFYNIYFLSLASKFYSPKNEASLFSKKFIERYRDILNWQKKELDNVSVDPLSCSTEFYQKVETAYRQRRSHLGKFGKSRVLRFETIWETVYVLMNLGLEKGMKVVDIGCENSCLPTYFAYLGCQSYGLDAFYGTYGKYFREKILDFCVDKTLILNVNAKGNGYYQVIYKIRDASQTEFPDNFFDRITCIQMMRHTSDDTAVMKEVSRILKPGGIVAITFPITKKYSEQIVHNDDGGNANRLYSPDSIFNRLIKPSGLKLIKPSSLEVSLDNSMPCVIFLRKPR